MTDDAPMAAEGVGPTRWRRILVFLERMTTIKRAGSNSDKAVEGGADASSRARVAEAALPLRYFDGVLRIELREVDRRRTVRAGGKKATSRDVAPVGGVRGVTPVTGTGAATAPQASTASLATPPPPPSADALDPFHPEGDPPDVPRFVDPNAVEHRRTRPRPTSCSAVGLAHSGGGIRSAAMCLGSLQALQKHGLVESIDYLSTVSGGGYIGASLVAALSCDGEFPFGSDIRDNRAISHLRNYSNYLMPRGRSSIRNGAEAAAILLRGWLANGIVVATLVIAAALATRFALGVSTTGCAARGCLSIDPFVTPLDPTELPSGFLLTTLAGLAFAAVLLTWALLRSLFPVPLRASDSEGVLLAVARTLLVLTCVLAFVELQPVLISSIVAWSASRPHASPSLKAVTAFLTAFSGAVSACSTALGRFLNTTERTTSTATLIKRAASKLAILTAALVLPLLVWAAYLILSTALIAGPASAGWLPILDQLWSGRGAGSDAELEGVVRALILTWAAGTAIALLLSPNAYSLHRFYRDRLSRAFLFHILSGNVAGGTRGRETIEPRLADLKLSSLQTSSGPYPIINAAMNVQGSVEANRRGRDADFFVFTPHFIGSDLTFYARTADAGASGDGPEAGMEGVDTGLDLGTAMAISGAAVSANMGGSTIRALSPTLALLNIRLGYWMRNPRFAGGATAATRLVVRALERAFGKFYLLAEMFNFLSERYPSIYLTDGGHIENLGVYELLKRGCNLIVVIDAEADPEMAFPSLLKLERFARIDFGVRIVLPWEQIAGARSCPGLNEPGGASGQAPHCAIGRIHYADGGEGLILYCKSSVSGDEKDYILDYRRRNPAFPHETTGDQFFTEEQFEMYRALGFHIVDGLFDIDDPKPIAHLDGAKGGFADEDAARQEVRDALSAWLFAPPAQPVAA